VARESSQRPSAGHTKPEPTAHDSSSGSRFYVPPKMPSNLHKKFDNFSPKHANASPDSHPSSLNQFSQRINRTVEEEPTNPNSNPTPKTVADLERQISAHQRPLHHTESQRVSAQTRPEALVHPRPTEPSQAATTKKKNPKSNVHTILDSPKSNSEILSLINNPGSMSVKSNGPLSQTKPHKERLLYDSSDTKNAYKPDKTILEAIKQFKYLDTSTELVLSNYVHVSTIQYQIAKNCKANFRGGGKLHDKSLIDAIGWSTTDSPGTPNQKMLLLDLDETLVRSEEFQGSKKYDEVIDVRLGPSASQKVGVRLRPHCIGKLFFFYDKRISEKSDWQV
jgi:hypothetical protein